MGLVWGEGQFVQIVGEPGLGKSRWVVAEHAYGGLALPGLLRPRTAPQSGSNGIALPNMEAGQSRHPSPTADP